MANFTISQTYLKNLSTLHQGFIAENYRVFDLVEMYEENYCGNKSCEIDYAKFGSCLKAAREESLGNDKVVFVVPGTQQIAGSILIENEELLQFLHDDVESFTRVPREKAFSKTHNLVKASKDHFENIINHDESYIKNFDSKDLVYQCLFRLMSFNPQEYCNNRIIKGSFYGFLYDNILDGFKPRENVFREIFEEQKHAILHEYYEPESELFSSLSSLLPIRGKLEMRGTEPIIKFNNGEEKLEFLEMNCELASRIHRAFHYIHTPRTDGITLGLFVKGQQLPISTISVEKVDREYKKSALINYNISPRHTYEITRLYSAKNAPANTSSFMLAMTNQYLKNYDRNWQATLSSFMPSYAAGLSMLSGGFSDVLFAKRCQHNYEGLVYGGLITRTNRSSQTKDFVTNKTNLMPVLELIAARQNLVKAVLDDKQVLIASNYGVYK